jgi:hypothetical protein
VTDLHTAGDKAVGLSVSFEEEELVGAEGVSSKILEHRCLRTVRPVVLDEKPLTI